MLKKLHYKPSLLKESYYNSTPTTTPTPTTLPIRNKEDKIDKFIQLIKDNDDLLLKPFHMFDYKNKTIYRNHLGAKNLFSINDKRDSIFDDNSILCVNHLENIVNDPDNKYFFNNLIFMLNFFNSWPIFVISLVVGVLYIMIFYLIDQEKKSKIPWIFFVIAIGWFSILFFIIPWLDISVKYKKDKNVIRNINKHPNKSNCDTILETKIIRDDYDKKFKNSPAFILLMILVALVIYAFFKTL